MTEKRVPSNVELNFRYICRSRPALSHVVIKHKKSMLFQEIFWTFPIGLDVKAKAEEAKASDSRGNFMSLFTIG